MDLFVLISAQVIVLTNAFTFTAEVVASTNRAAPRKATQWILGQDAQSCDEACTGIGLECNVSDLLEIGIAKDANGNFLKDDYPTAKLTAVSNILGVTCITAGQEDRDGLGYGPAIQTPTGFCYPADNSENFGASCFTFFMGYQRFCPCGSSSEGKAVGDPHAIYGNREIAFKLPEHYVNLFTQGDFKVFALGGAPTQGSSLNFIYKVSLRIGSDEIIRIHQKNETASQTEAQLDVFLQGARYSPPSVARMITIPGNADLTLKISDRVVVVQYAKLKVHIRSSQTHWKQKVPNHLDFAIKNGLDPQKAWGALPELWGLRPMSAKVRRMLDHVEAF